MDYIYNFTVLAYEKEFKLSSGKGTYCTEACHIIIYAENEEQALAKAKFLITKKYYKVIQVREEFDHTGMQREAIKVMRESLGLNNDKPWLNK